MPQKEEWDHITERRRHWKKPESEDEMWELIHDMSVAISLHLDEEKLLRPKVEELVTILERSKGVLALFKVLVYIGAPLAAFIAWAKDHIRL